MNKHIRAFIVFSVLLNILLAGFVAVHIGSHVVRAQERTEKSSTALPPLPQQKREQYEQVLKQIGTENRILREQTAVLRKKAGEQMEAEHFDKDAYLRTIGRMQELRSSMTIETARRIADFAATLTYEERKALTDSMHQRWRAREKELVEMFTREEPRQHAAGRPEAKRQDIPAARRQHDGRARRQVVMIGKQ